MTLPFHTLCHSVALPYHIPEVVSLKEGKHFTYSYPCEEGVVDWLCYYIDGMVQPAIFDVANLPPFLQDGTSSANQECPGFSTYNITFTVTTSMSGLFMFYAKGSGCDFTNGVGPRPFLFNITTGKRVTTYVVCLVSSHILIPSTDCLQSPDNTSCGRLR